MKRISPGLKRLAALGLVWTVGFLMLVVSFDILIIRNFLPWMPPRLQALLPRPFQVLAQSSKRYTIPRDYIMITGDSNAMGAGDWLYRRGDWRCASYGSHHLIHDKTGRDVISFGVGGVGSLGGFAVYPAGLFESLRRTALYRIEPPQTVLCYFYEGNDPIDNLFDMHNLKRPIQSLVEESSLYQTSQKIRWYHDLVILRMIRNLRVTFPPVISSKYDQPVRGYNRIVAGGSTLTAADCLQAPPVHLRGKKYRHIVRVTEESLKFLIKYFDGADFYLIYIPSPAVIYTMSDGRVRVSDEVHGRPMSVAIPPQEGFFSSRYLANASYRLKARIRRMSARLGMNFLDTTENLRMAAQRENVHGPRDWNHLNQRGYEALSDAIVRRMLRDAAV